MKKVFLFLAPGFEILEAAAPIDVLERCKVEVEKVSLEKDLMVLDADRHSVLYALQFLLHIRTNLKNIVLR